MRLVGWGGTIKEEERLERLGQRKDVFVRDKEKACPRKTGHERKRDQDYKQFLRKAGDHFEYI